MERDRKEQAYGKHMFEVDLTELSNEIDRNNEEKYFNFCFMSQDKWMMMPNSVRKDKET